MRISEVRKELQALETDGRLTPEQVVAEAKKKASAMHSYFEWDDSKAAHEYRVEQARTLIRSVKITVENETRSVRTPYYVRDPGLGDKEQGYISMPKLRTEKDLAREAIVDEFSRAAASLRRARDIAEALGMADKVDGLIADVVDVQRSVQVEAPTARQ